MNTNQLDDWLRQARPQTVLLAMVSVVAMTLLAGHLYVVGPSLARLRALDGGENLDSVEALKSEADQTRAAIAASEATLEGLRGQLYGGPSDQPPEKVESYIVDQLDSLSVRHAVELMSVEPGDAQHVLMFDELLYEVEVKGDFLSLAAWLGEIEDELRPLVVNGFDLRPAERRPWVRMRLRLASYRPRGGVS